MEGDDWALVLEPHAQPPQLRRVRLAGEVVDPLGPVLELRIDHRLGPAGAQYLRAVRAEIGDGPDRDHRARLRGPTPAHARHHPVAPGDLGQEPARIWRYARIGGALDDRRQRAVDVEQDRRARRIGAQWRERFGEER